MTQPGIKSDLLPAEEIAERLAMVIAAREWTEEDFVQGVDGDPHRNRVLLRGLGMVKENEVRRLASILEVPSGFLFGTHHGDGVLWNKSREAAQRPPAARPFPKPKKPPARIIRTTCIGREDLRLIPIKEETETVSSAKEANAPPPALGNSDEPKDPQKWERDTLDNRRIVATNLMRKLHEKGVPRIRLGKHLEEKNLCSVTMVSLLTKEQARLRKNLIEEIARFFEVEFEWFFVEHKKEEFVLKGGVF